MHHADHLTQVLNPLDLRSIATHLAAKIESDKSKYPIDAIAVRGVSGLTVGSVVSVMTGIPMVIVRKTKTAHSSYTVEYAYEFHSYVVIDDLVATGDTLEEIAAKLSCTDAKFIKLYTYLQGTALNMRYVCEQVKLLTNRWYGFQLNPPSSYDLDFTAETLT